PSATVTPSASPTPTATPKQSAKPKRTPAPSPTKQSHPDPVPSPKTTHTAPKPSPTPAQHAEPAPQSLVDAIVTRTNAERTKAGLPALKVSSCATKQAAARTKVLVEEDRFEHDPLGPIVEACGSGTVGENLALGYPSAKAVVAGWMASEGHRANILGKQYKKIGVGCTKGPHGQLCAQVFLG
ncbi:MAG: CAP domain-containing protein, partial [Brevundimonas sp.]